MLQNMKSIILLAILHVGVLRANTDIVSKFQDKTDIDPKEAFFKHFQFYNSQQLSSESESESEPDHNLEAKQFRNIPIPGGFEFSGFSGSDSDNRKFIKVNDTTKGKYLISEESVKNDFVRFKRQSQNKEIVDKDNGRQKREPELESRTKQIIGSELNRGAERERETRGVTKEQWIKQPYPVERPAEQESFDNNDNVPSASASDTIRAPRVHFVTTQRRPLVGGTPGPASVPVPASAPSVFREREGRSRDRDRDLYSYSYPHLYPVPVPVPLPVYPHPRPRSYEPYRPRYYDPYYQHYDNRDRERERRYRYGFDIFDDGRAMLPPPPPPSLPPSPLQSKQRRIIYYATLPEVVRNPSSERPRPRPSPSDRGQSEPRYSYRSGYNEYNGGYNGYNGHDGRYVHHPDSDTDYRSQKQRDHEREYNARTRTSTNSNTSGGNGSGSSNGNGSGSSNSNGNGSPTTNTNSNKTPLYPVKVSTDVNVRDRESKKNPERRIYSELDKRFNYKTPDVANF